MGSVLNYVKKHLTAFILYGALGVCTLVLGITLIVWAAVGEAEKISEVRPATIVATGDIQTEYLVGQQFDLSGISLNIGTEKKPEIIPSENCSVEADFTSSGKKTVKVIYRLDDYISYCAEIDAEVIFVRSIEITAYPTVITVGEANSITTDDSFEMYATLATAPQTDAFGQVESVESGYRVKLENNTYRVSCVADTQADNLYNATFYCGDVSASFSFYNAAGRSFIVSSAKDIVSFTPENAESGSSLTLVVTERDSSYQDTCTGVTEGFYVYRDTNGEEKLYNFGYELKEKAEVLKSAQVEERAEDGYYTASIEGEIFRADAAVWQSAVVRGNIIDDHGFKLVVDSSRRVLNFTYQSEEEEENVPTLTLYATEYDMNPLLGTGNGYSRGIYIFTDVTGYSYKLKFYMQAYTWTYVPMSSTFNDPSSDVSIEWDYVFNPTAPPDQQYDSYYRGDLYARISVYSRGEGFKTVVFSAPETEWLGALLGM